MEGRDLPGRAHDVENGSELHVGSELLGLVLKYESEVLA
jgi:hypothetical protein